MEITMEETDAALDAEQRRIMIREMSLDSFVLQEIERPQIIVMNGVGMGDDLIIQILLIHEETCLDLWSGHVMTEIYDKGMVVMTIAELKKDFSVMGVQLQLLMFAMKNVVIVDILAMINAMMVIQTVLMDVMEIVILKQVGFALVEIQEEHNQQLIFVLKYAEMV